MDLIMTLKAILLGIVEGVTEFLPVSSTGHLILVGEFIHFDDPGNVFDIVIQLGSILAVCWLFRDKLINTVISLPKSKESQHFTASVLVAFLPAVVLGALAHGFIKSHLFNPWVVSIAMIVGGFIILLIERKAITPRYHAIDAIPLPVAVKIGFFQTIAMVPGVSRSGATIMGSLLLKLDRRLATEFSFFLAIPTMFAATVYDLFKHRHDLTMDHMSLIAVGFVAAFICSLFVVKWLINFVSTHGFTPFAIYRIIVGLVMLGVLLLR